MKLGDKMINIINDRYAKVIKKELVRRGLVEDLKLNPRTNVVTLKTNIEEKEIRLLGSKAMMALATNRYGNVKVEVIKSDVSGLKR